LYSGKKKRLPIRLLLPVSVEQQLTVRVSLELKRLRRNGRGSFITGIFQSNMHIVVCLLVCMYCVHTYLLKSFCSILILGILCNIKCPLYILNCVSAESQR
jgi:hypothetical protein